MANSESQPNELFEYDLREAWAARDFDLAYQPQVNLCTKCVTGFEALLRWHHPIRGDVPPDSVILLAETLGLIDGIGEWVLERACREATGWPDDIYVAVNVSAIQLKNENLPEIVSSILQRSGLASSRLELEVTESAVMPDDPGGLAVLRKIQSTGVRIVMDDFDLGYSSLGYLLRFSFDKIKLDRSFIDRILQNQSSHDTARAIVHAIVGLCSNLNITFLAEGVETEEQLALLTKTNCAEVQGYLCGRPLPAAGVAGVLQSLPRLLNRLDIGGEAVGAISGRLMSLNVPFFQIAETANDIIIVTSPDLKPPGPKILYVNPAFTRLTGYSAAEAIGQTPRILQGPGTSRATLDTIGEALGAGLSVHEKILNFGKSGAPYWLDLHIVALHDIDGKITHFAAIERDVTLDKRRLDELEHLVDRDTLTGIPNRRAFLRATELEIEASGQRRNSASETKGPCLAFVDVDHFKLVNDQFGHAVGDAVLCSVAECMAENVRRLDILGRIGGEEFAVCMPSVTLQEAKALAERLRWTIARTPMATPIGPVSITVSIGVTCFNVGDAVTTMTERADAGMYAAKQAGRNRVRTRDKLVV